MVEGEAELGVQPAPSQPDFLLVLSTGCLSVTPIRGWSMQPFSRNNFT
jgi:hypothetical protein